MGKGRTPCCEKGRVKKGPWSQEEDLKLISFIQRHGHSNWRSLPMLAGLARCGKSCRLRWVNYLRPDVKRGILTADEEETVIKLQSLIGNKWSKIASHLPGRTDNEIKNIWNTHLKKRLTDKNSSKIVTKSTDHDQDKVSNEPSSYDHFDGQGPATSMSPKDDMTIEFSSSDCTTRDSYSHEMIDATQKIPYEEPNLVDLWESLMLDAGNQYEQLNPNIHDCDGGKQSSIVSKGETLVSKKDMQGRSNYLCPFELLNNFEFGKMNNETTTTTTTMNNGAYQEITDEQTYQLEEAFPNDGLLKMDNKMESYLEIMAWPSSSPTCFSFSGF